MRVPAEVVQQPDIGVMDGFGEYDGAGGILPIGGRRDGWMVFVGAGVVWAVTFG